VLHDPADETDFTCPKVMQPNRRFADKCIACGTSLIAERPDAERSLGTLYFKRKRAKLALGSTRMDCGLVLDTPSDSIPPHITYWIYPGSSVHNDFRVMS